MKPHQVHVLEVVLLRLISMDKLPGIVEADNRNPGEGIMFLYTADGSKLRLEMHNTAFVIIQICEKQNDVIQGVVKLAILAGKPCFVYTTDVVDTKEKT